MSAAPGAAADPPQRLPPARVLSHALGDAANSLVFQLTAVFLIVYLTDVAGVPVAAAGAVYAATRVWAGIADLIALGVVDRAHTRWGRLRPWLLWGSLPLAALLVVLFSTPAGLGVGQVIAWVLLVDGLLQLVSSAVNLPYGALSASLSGHRGDRTRLAGARSVASALAAVGLSAVGAPQFQDTTVDDVRLRFTIAVAVVAAVAAGLYLACFATAREVVPVTLGPARLRQTMETIGQSAPLLMLCGSTLLSAAAMVAGTAMALFYARDVLGSAAFLIVLVLAQTVGLLAGSALPSLLWVGKRTGFWLMAAVALVGYLLVLLGPQGGPGLVVAALAWLLLGLGSGGMNALLFALQSEAIDVGEWRTGVRAETGSFGVASVVRKCGQALGGGAAAAVIAGFGYLPGSLAQPAEAVLGIRVAAGGLPALLVVLAAAVLALYPLTRARHQDLVAELTERSTLEFAAQRIGARIPELQVMPLGDGRTMVVTGARGRIPPVVTLTEADGSGAREVAAAVAERLGVGLILPDEPTEPARTPTRLARLVRRVGLGGSPDADLARAVDLRLDHEQVVANGRFVVEAVRNGGVVLGRNAAPILRRAVGVLHVRLTAPPGVRLRRVSQRTGLDLERAAASLANPDGAELPARLYGWDVDDDQAYDLVVNTGSFTYERVADTVVRVYRSKYPNPSR